VSRIPTTHLYAEEDELHRLLARCLWMSSQATPGAPTFPTAITGGSGAPRYRVPWSTEGVLAAVLDAALTVTETHADSCWLKKAERLEVTVAVTAVGSRLASLRFRCPRTNPARLG